jgi:hypothetical protein
VLKKILGEGFVVLDACLFHQAGVCCHAFDERIGVELKHAGLVSAVGEDFDA